MNTASRWAEFQELRDLLELKSAHNIKKILDAYADIFSAKSFDDVEFLEDSDRSKKGRQTIRGWLVEIVKLTDSIDLFAFAAETDRLAAKVHEFGRQRRRGLKETGPNSYTLSSLIVSIENFKDAFQNHVRKKNIHSATVLSLASSKFDSLRLGTIEVISSAFPASLESTKTTENQRTLDLYLGNVTSASDHGHKFTAIAAIYSELMRLAGESESDYPLQVLYLEEGSQFSKFCGHAAIIVVLSQTLSTGADYFIDTYTKTGKLTQLSLATNVAKDTLEITEKLQAAGYETDGEREEVKIATRQIAKQLNELLMDQPEVAVDGQTYSVPEALSDRYIEEAKQKKLPQLPPDTSEVVAAANPEAGPELEE